MSEMTPLEDISHQVQRTEELIKLKIQKFEKKQKLSIDIAKDHTDSSKQTRNEFLAGIGVIISFLGTLSQTSFIDPMTSVLWITYFAVLGFFIYVGWNRRLRKLNNAFGEEIACYDAMISPFEKIHEILVLETINAYKGHFQAIRATATMISFLDDLVNLYQIKPYEMLIKTQTFDRGVNQTMFNRIKFLKNEARYYVKQYYDMKRYKIPLECRTITQSVINDNQQYIDWGTFRQPCD